MSFDFSGITNAIGGLGGQLLGSLGNIAGGITDSIGGMFGGEANSIGNDLSKGFSKDAGGFQYSGTLADGTQGWSSDVSDFSDISGAYGDLSGSGITSFAGDSKFNPAGFSMQGNNGGGLGGNLLDNALNIGKLYMAKQGFDDSMKTSKLKRKAFTTSYNDTVAAKNADEDRKASLRRSMMARSGGTSSPNRTTTYHTV